MGKGDVKTKKGKRFRSSYGNTRPKPKKDSGTVVAVAKEKPAKKTTVKKAVTAKTETAKKTSTAKKASTTKKAETAKKKETPKKEDKSE